MHVLGNTLNREDVWLRRMHGLEKENGLHYTTAVVAQSTAELLKVGTEIHYRLVASGMNRNTLPM